MDLGWESDLLTEVPMLVSPPWFITFHVFTARIDYLLEWEKMANFNGEDVLQIVYNCTAFNDRYYVLLVYNAKTLLLFILLWGQRMVSKRLVNCQRLRWPFTELGPPVIAGTRKRIAVTAILLTILTTNMSDIT